MNIYIDLLKKMVRVITVITFKNGRKIKTDYLGHLVREGFDFIIIKELDGKEIKVFKKYIKRIEEDNGR